MSKTIKTRSTVKSVKTLDKAANIGVRMKNAFIRSKRNAEQTQDTGVASPSEYASDTVFGRAGGVTQTAAYRTKRKLRHPLQKAQSSFERAKQRFRDMRKQHPREYQKTAEQARTAADHAKQTTDTLGSKAKEAQKAAEQAKTTVTDAIRALQQTRQAGRQTIQTAKQASTAGMDTLHAGKQTGRGIQASAKSVKATGKGTIKTVQKSAKTAERTAKTAVKTAKHTAKTAQRSAKATAKSARMAARASRAAAKAAVRTAKAATKAVIAMIKAAIAAVKGLVALIAAGGWVAVLIIIVICLIGLLVGSVFGIFFSGEDSGTGCSMPSAVLELSDEFYQKIEDIKNANPHDIEDISPMSINWPEVQAVYAVKVNTDPNNPAEVATLDDNKLNILRSILNDAVTLSHSLTYEVQEQTVTDAEGNETTETVIVTTLVVTLTQKSANELAVQYGFNQKQKEQLAELLSSEYADLWALLLGGYVKGNGEILTGDISRVPTDIFSWPVTADYPITSPFGYRTDPFTGATKFHGGIDIAAPEGTPVLAAADGIVVVANSTDSWGGGYGYYVKLQHDGGYATQYAHCSKIAVTGGQEVRKGQVIGYIGSTGRSTGNHLHWEVWKDGTRVNPLGYFE